MKVYRLHFQLQTQTLHTLAFKMSDGRMVLSGLLQASYYSLELIQVKHAYIASSTEGSGLRGIEIGTHNGAGAREKFFVGDADGGVGLYYDNNLKSYKQQVTVLY